MPARATGPSAAVAWRPSASRTPANWPPPREVDLMALDEALEALERVDAQQRQIVELRYFGGLSIEETAQVLGVSPATVKRDWRMARAWLHRELSSACRRES